MNCIALSFDRTYCNFITTKYQIKAKNAYPWLKPQIHDKKESVMVNNTFLWIIGFATVYTFKRINSLTKQRFYIVIINSKSNKNIEKPITWAELVLTVVFNVSSLHMIIKLFTTNFI